MPPKKLNIEKELLKNDFRVTIFGSARIKSEDPIYQDVYELAYKIGQKGYDLVTGGGPGLMEAASTGHTAGDELGQADSIGLNIQLPFEQKPNPGLEYLDNHELFSSRLDEFMLLSDVVVVTPGGIGTCLELFYTWQLIQVKHICKIPLILVGKQWHKLVEWVIDYPLRDKYLDSKDLHSIVLVNKAVDAMKIIEKAKKNFDENKDGVCHDWQQYGKKMKKLSALIGQKSLKKKS